MDKFGFIGLGNMGYAMLSGASKALGAEQFIATDVNASQRDRVEQELHIKTVASNKECIKDVKYIVLAVKPQVYDKVLADIKSVITEQHIVISLAPGVTISQISKIIGEDKRIFRIMPNTPALVGEGMTAGCYSEHIYELEEEEMLQKFFTSFGKFVIVEEKLMSAVVCASGSSPAYVYMFIEALADSVVKYGLPRDKAYELVAQTVLGSAKMVLETKEHPGLLKDKVCSPGGTTIAGVEALEEAGMRSSLFKATKACYEKAENIK